MKALIKLEKNITARFKNISKWCRNNEVGYPKTTRAGFKTTN